MACKLRDQAIRLFKSSFDYSPTTYAYAPGRVNFIGEHTDYCDGFVCPFAIHLGTVVVGCPVPGNKCRVVSSSMDGIEEFKGDCSLVPREKGEWINYVAGVVYEFITRFDKPAVGFDLAIVSDLPIGSGVSSSASLEVAVSVFLEQILKIAISPEERALLCQSAEHRFPQMPCGIMDQFIVSCGVKGSLLLIDCRSNKGELVPFDDPSVSILVCNSNVKHQLTGSEYPDRVKQCKEAVEKLQTKYPEVQALRDATVEQVESLKEEMGDVVYRRALHVVSECQRCLDCKEALEAREYDRVGGILMEGHASLRDNFEVSTPELDALVEIAIEQTGVYGARMTGGGFGGCVICLVETSYAKSVEASIRKEYKDRTGVECDVFVTSPAQGARVITAEERDESSEIISLWKRPVFWLSTAAVVGAMAMVIMHKRR